MMVTLLLRSDLVLAGPIDTGMSRDLTLPKAAPEDVAAAVFDGVLRGDEDIFPDPLSAPLAETWESGLIKTFERANAAVLPSPDYTTSYVVAKPPAAVRT